jgi:hypothetical protein
MPQKQPPARTAVSVPGVRVMVPVSLMASLLQYVGLPV